MAEREETLLQTERKVALRTIKSLVFSARLALEEQAEQLEALPLVQMEAAVEVQDKSPLVWPILLTRALGVRVERLMLPELMRLLRVVMEPTVLEALAEAGEAEADLRPSPVVLGVMAQQVRTAQSVKS